MNKLLSVLPILIFMIMNPIELLAESKVTWSVVDPKSKQEVPVGEKGSVQEAFFNAGLLPNPFDGENESLYQWMEDHKWTFKGQFVVRYDDAKQDHLILEFPSVDTYATIKLNGKVIGTTNNAFRTWRYDVKGLVRIGTNFLEVEFTPPVMMHLDEYKKEKYHLPAPNDVHGIAIAPKVRKPQYHFGWDWTLRLNLMGFHQPVRFYAYSKLQSRIANVQTKAIQGNTADLELTWDLSHIPDGATWRSANFTLTEISRKGSQFSAKVRVVNPILWWPNGYGDAHLYTDVWTLKDKEGKLIAKKDIRFGIRTSELIQEKDQWGTSYQIRVNGKDVFCKGSNVIPQEVFISKVDNKRIDDLLRASTFANVNMLRIWGGGYYPPDYFYERCDELGIMVWQDFMFACAMYPGDDAFLDNVAKEAEEQINRISPHPSVVLFNGNNEVDMAWKNWGFQLKYLLGPKAQREIESFYDKLFKNLLAEKVKELTTLPYIHTSPLSNWGKDEYYNHGSQHYWGVWHGKDPIEDMGNKSGRFNAEYGFQSFPTYSTLSAFSKEEDWALNSSVMKHHQKSPVGNGMIKKHSDNLFGKADDFMDFVYYSQLTQAKAVELAVASHRATFPQCAGTIYWQLNDCWPAPTWSSVDYYENYKALHYRMNQLFRPTAVVAVERKLGEKDFHVVTELKRPQEVQVEYFDLDGNFLEMHVLPVEVNTFGIKRLPLEMLQQKKLTNYIARFMFDQDPLTEQFFFNETDRPREAQNFVQFELKTTKDGKQMVVVETKKAMLDVWITSKSKHLFVKNNFTVLLPGKHEFEVKCDQKLTKEDIILKFR